MKGHQWSHLFHFVLFLSVKYAYSIIDLILYKYHHLLLSRIFHVWINTLGPRQNGRHFANDIFKCIFLNENVWISIKISLKFVPKGPINNIPSLFQIMAWRRPGDKPLSEAMMVNLPTHICVTRPQWVKNSSYISRYASNRPIACSILWNWGGKSL